MWGGGCGWGFLRLCGGFLFMCGFSEGTGKRGGMAGRIKRSMGEEAWLCRILEAMVHDIDGSQERAMRQRPTVGMEGSCSLDKKRTLCFDA